MHLSNEIKKTSTYYRTISNNSIQENGCNYLNCKLTGIGTEYMGKLNISRYLRRFMNYFHSIIDPIIYFLINIFLYEISSNRFCITWEKYFNMSSINFKRDSSPINNFCRNPTRNIAGILKTYFGKYQMHNYYNISLQIRSLVYHKRRSCEI